MRTLVEILPLMVVVPALIFWGWMFRAMWADPDLPVNADSSFSWPPRSKNAWTLVFILLNVFGAYFYFSWNYRDRS